MSTNYELVRETNIIARTILTRLSGTGALNQALAQAGSPLVGDGLQADGSIVYRGFTLMVSSIQIHIWEGHHARETVGGPPEVSLLKAKALIDSLLRAKGE